MTTLDIRYYIRAWDWRLVGLHLLVFWGWPNVYQLYRVPPHRERVAGPWEP